MTIFFQKRWVGQPLLMLALLCGAAATTQAQSGPYGNEWIDYSKTYVKFKVAASTSSATLKDGVYRISKAALDAAGVPAATPGTAFSLWRDGKELALAPTTQGTFGGSDFIEFFGERPNGMLDEELYAPAANLPNKGVSLFSDTATYFLTWDAGTPQAHLRYTATANTLSGTLPPAEAFFWSTVRLDYKSSFLAGEFTANHQNFFSSEFTAAEGYISSYRTPPSTASVTMATPGVLNAGVNARLAATILSESDIANTSQFKVKLNTTEIKDTSWGATATVHFNLPDISSLLVSSGNNTLTFEPQGGAGIGIDYYGISTVAIEYPRSFDLTGTSTSYLDFKLDPGANAQYLEFTGFNNAANTPRLYDLTNKKYYTGDITTVGMVRFYVQPSATERRMILYSDNNTTNLATILPSKTFQFTDFSAPAKQGNYLIITHKQLQQVTNGHNYVQDYADYRGSTAGGSYTVATADVDELYDQFAYGINQHPLSIKHFIRYAYDNWTTKPEYTYLIGRGLLYYQWRTYVAQPDKYPFPIVPTYGHPGSDVDFVNFASNRHQAIKIGRLSVWNPAEIGTYLEKVKAFDQAVKPASLPTVATEMWKKQVLHIAGGSDPYVSSQLLATLNNGKAIIEAPCTGKSVTTVQKTSVSAVDVINNATVDSLIKTGVSMITFHGHASSNIFDYNLNNPETYNNSPRLPFFTALGCDVAQMFALDIQKTITERWVLAQNSGAVAMLAADNTGYTDFHGRYLPALYNSMAKEDYGQTIGQFYRRAYDTLMTISSQNGYASYYFTHLESMLLIGDPAIKLSSPPLPDFHVAASGLSANPANVTTSNDSFQLKIATFNLGKAGCGGPDSVQVRVEHTNPAGATATVATYITSALVTSDTAQVRIPVDHFQDLGLNRYTVTIDYLQEYDEVSEANNSATLDLFIASDKIVPVYPKEFAIVYQQGVTLKASTLNPFRPVGNYRFEIDTTERFNSPQKQSTVITSIGGVIHWTPTLSMQDSMVYYWRTAVDSNTGNALEWANSSFIYLAGGSPGWSQSHFYQWNKDTYADLQLDSNDRTFKFPATLNNLQVRNTVVANDFEVSNSSIYLNYNKVQGFTQDPNGALQIMVFDGISGKPWKNSVSQYAGTQAPVGSILGIFVTEFNIDNPTERNRASHFLDSIPNGNYVMIKNAVYRPAWAHTTKDDLIQDNTTYPADTTLYERLQELGFNQIDDFDTLKAFIFWRRKGDNTVPVEQYVNSGANGDNLLKEFNFKSYPDSGRMTSTIIGPATAWTALRWKIKPTATTGNLANDHAFVQVSGITPANTIVPLFTTANIDTPLTGISAAAYPNLRLDWISIDSAERNSIQQRYWRVIYTPVPEAALNPAAWVQLPDSSSVGQTVTVGVAIENLTELPMDSMLVRYRVINNGNAPQDLSYQRYRPLPGFDTLHATVRFSPDAFAGANLLFIEANPDNDQPEQYHPNNLGYIPFKVGRDLLNPLLDVTFDGIHILNRDIVSSTPFVKVLLRDENKYLALDDTSLLQVALRYPNEAAGTSHPIVFDGTVCKFIPAQSNGKNEAAIEFRPTLPQDGIYELIVNGKDKSGNKAASASYNVEFEVVNKSTITNVLNYPNPFSTATSFVFTLTGSQIPSQFKIQILSVTGKVVKEITKQQLGALHVGRNITEYQWDGKDEYGQLLGNGVYLYRVVTAINGTDVEQRASGADKFFKNGYGKLYIMR